jgi:uncharacterized protein YabN with tetrapyrrole methylase and pyrophosphatase domain
MKDNVENLTSSTVPKTIKSLINCNHFESLQEIILIVAQQCPHLGTTIAICE